MQTESLDSLSNHGILKPSKCNISEQKFWIYITHRLMKFDECFVFALIIDVVFISFLIDSLDFIDSLQR